MNRYALHVRRWIQRLPTRMSFVNLKFLFLVLVLSCASLGAVRLLSKARYESEGLALLKKAYKAHRPLESRIAEFEYAPFLMIRGAGEKPAAEDSSVRHAERVLRDAVFYSPDARSHHALGVFHLLNRQLDDAIKEFEAALRYQPSNPQLHNDLGSALLEKGKAELESALHSQFTGKPIEYLSRSFEHIHNALVQDATLREATFNLGLVEEALGLRSTAKNTFSSYLELDSDSNWGHEIREKLSGQYEMERALSLSNEQLLADFLDAFGRSDEDSAWKLICENRSPLNHRFISELLIDAFIVQSLAGKKEEAIRSLSALSFLGDLEVRRANEHYSADLGEFYKTRTRGDLARLSRARGLVERGHELYVVDKGDDAIASYTEAGAEFEALGDRCESLTAEYRIAYCESENRNIAVSLPLFKRLAALSEERGYVLLQIRSLLGIASNEFSREAYSRAISYGRQSFELATKVADEISAFGSLDSNLEFYKAVGNRKEVLACIQNNLKYQSCPSINRVQNFGHYSRVASALLFAGYVDASLEFRKEASNFLMRDVPRDAALYFADLGATYSRLKKDADALFNLNLAYEEAQAVAPEPAKNLTLAYVALQKAYLYKWSAEFQQALASYSEALTRSENANFPVFAYQARKGRLYCDIALGDDAASELEIVETMKLLEADRSAILEQENRNSFFDAEQDVYDLAIDYEYSRRHDPAKAFEYSEESRSRSLLNSLRREEQTSSGKAERPGLDVPEVSPALTLSAIQQKLPEHLQVIQYSVLANKILIWVLDSNQFSTSTVAISQEELKKKVKAYLGEISQDTGDESDSISAQAKHLYEILVKPVSHLLGRDQRICIVADKVLCNLPFETLISTETQTYLVEDFAVLYSPSSSVLIACNEEARIRQSADFERLLAVGNPDFDRSLYKGFSDLPAAKTEVERIAAYYRQGLADGSGGAAQPVVLIGSAASESKVTSEMQKATIIHFAAHSVLDDDSVLRSKILLSKEPNHRGQGSDGVLESREIQQTKLPKARLVVLSSCQSGIDRYYNGEGTMSLARSFMAAGVPTVVASLWEVDSSATAELMIEFHRLRQKEGLSVSESLRKAKLRMLNDPGGRFRHPYFWSAFILTGGQASY